MELSRKQLRELEKELGAYHISGNVYNYENILYAINHREWDKLPHDLFAYLQASYDVQDVHLYVSNQIAYSHGTYGNNGQMHKVNVYNKQETAVVDTFYISYN